MGPKRKAKVVGAVLKTTTKVVQERVQVTVVQGKDVVKAAEEIAEEEVEMGEEEVVRRTVIVQDREVPEEEDRTTETLQIPVEEKATAEGRGKREEEGNREEDRTAETLQIPVEEKGTAEGEEKWKEEGNRESQETEESTQEPGEIDLMEPEREEERPGDKSPEIRGAGEEKQKEAETPRLGKQAEKKKEKYVFEQVKTPERQEVGKVQEAGKTKRSTATSQRGGEEKNKRRKRRAGEVVGEQQYRTYIHKVLKQVHPDLGISWAALEVLNGYMNDMFERLAEEAAKLSRSLEKKTLSSREIEGAVKLVLPGELGRHAIAEGAKAVVKFMSNDEKE